MSRVLPSLSVLALCAAAPAFADVTADELWVELHGLYSSQGQTLSVESTERTGNTLTVRGLTTSLDQNGIRSSSSLDELVLTENGDGTVTMTMSELYQFESDFPDPDGGPNSTIGFDMRLEGFETLVSGTAEARRYDYETDLITMTTRDVGSDADAPEMDLLVIMQGNDGVYTLDNSNPDDIAFVAAGTLDSMAMGLNVEPSAADEGSAKVTFRISDMQLDMEGSLGDYASVIGDPEAFPQGFDVSMSVGYGSAFMDADFDDGSSSGELEYLNAGGSLEMAMSESELGLRITERGTEAALSASDLPFPVEYSVGAMEFAMDLPVEAQAAPTPFAGRLALEDVTVSETILSMFDPSQAIARDPITMIVDVTGAAQMFVSLFDVDPDKADEAPGELRALTLNELRLSVGGAELTGTGDMTFAPGQEVPMPVGSVDLAMTGGNALIDSLVATGLVPAEQLMMVRAMTGMFARPGPTPDSLESSIVFGADGSITANGVPLQ